MMMPRLDGFGLLGRCAPIRSCATCRCILLSARAGEEARVEGVDAGADDYLTKPFSARELLARVGANLAMARLRRESLQALRGLNETLEARVAERTRERDRIWRLSRDLMLVAQINSTAVAVNPAGRTTLGWSESELVGRRIEDLVHADDRAATSAELAKLADGRRRPIDLNSACGTVTGVTARSSGRRCPTSASCMRWVATSPMRGRQRSGSGRPRRWRRSAS